MTLSIKLEKKQLIALNKNFLLSLMLVSIISACSGSKTKDSDEDSDGVETPAAEGADAGASSEGDTAKTDALPDASTEVPAAPGTDPSPAAPLDALNTALPGSTTDTAAPALAPDSSATSSTLGGSSPVSMSPSTTMADTSTPPAPVAPIPATGTASESSVGSSGDTYTVRRGDTLMKIAFRSYGDVFKWKEIYELNKDHISNPNSLSAGTTIKLSTGATEHSSHPSGEKYLIQTGDTLAKISNTLYGTTAKWKQLWKHNKKLIKNPNLIFSGFYLYYVPSADSPSPGALTQKSDSSSDTAAASAPAPQQVSQQSPQQTQAGAGPAPAAVPAGLAGLSNALSAATPN